MNNFIKGFCLSLILALLCYFVPIWWLAAVAAAIAGFIFPNDGLKSFGAGFLSIALLWLVQSWWISSSNEGLLLSKISELLQMGSYTIYFITFTIAGLLGGFGYLTGAYSKLAFVGEGGKSRSKYRNKYK